MSAEAIDPPLALDGMTSWTIIEGAVCLFGARLRATGRAKQRERIRARIEATGSTSTKVSR
jgi:hypothetical protein